VRRLTFRAAGAKIALITTLVLSATVVGLAAPAQAALPNTSSPQLQLHHLMRTNPFAGSSITMKDNEGAAYVPGDNSLWLADDGGRRIYEVNPTTGGLKQTFDRDALAAVRQYGGTAQAGLDRARDLESMAYDSATDSIFVFSGSCCSSTVRPTAFRLIRNQSGKFGLDSYQPLPGGTDFTAAAWNPGDGKIYTGLSRDIRTYNYLTNTIGPAFQISGLSGILGMSFSADGADMFVARSSTRLTRVDWATKSLVSGWTFDLSSFGMLDTRAVELVNDQFWVSDGYDNRSTGDPKSHAVFVFDVVGSTPPPPPSAPTASFTASPTSGAAPLTVSFTDTSTGGPTGWQWHFGDGGTSTAQSPSHVFDAAGTYTVQLTASNGGGSSTASTEISVDAAPAPPPPTGNLITNPGFETSTNGWDTAGYAAVTLERVAGGRSGSWAAKVTNTGTTSVTNTLNDAPNTVATSSAGTYTGSVWVRSDVAGAKLYLRIREFQDKTKVSEKLVGVVLSTSWQQVTASLVPVSPGSTSIDFTAAVYSAPSGSSFYADDASLMLS